ncbi:amidohydrolase [Massilicoli timonensis]|uniref:Amidohydrolase n=1 Tax=Massilicoli timonensis TaxID=2015901 RepID=A0ABT1SLY1_9FIRM|nr:amidohydrolase [Massilicoli timonensis]MCQ5122218.1 amidohydrolase [Massilicoli timonensis]
MLIQNGNVFTMEKPGCEVMDILVDAGKIIEMGKHLAVTGDATIIDASGKNIYPGFIDAHCHLGMEETAIGFEGNDVNEMSDPITPQMRAIDALNPMDETLQNAYAGGVTTVCSGPGSANVIGGTFCVYKTYGTCIDEMIVKYPAAMKCAFGENPKRVYAQKDRIKTRMNTAALLRETLFKAKEYAAKKEAAGDDVSKLPAFDMKLEAMIPVIRKEIPLKAHAHRADDILTSIRIAKEFDLNMTLDHCTEGHLIIKQVVDSGFDAIVGPALTHKTKFELKNLTFATAGILSKAGMCVAINTDSPVVPQEYLPICAGLARKSGMDAFEALKAITINPAKILGVDDRIGSLRVGKDADLVMTEGDPLDTSGVIMMTMIDGKIVYTK